MMEELFGCKFGENDMGDGDGTISGVCVGGKHFNDDDEKRRGSGSVQEYV